MAAVVEKIRKLLNLAKSANVHEAASAAEAAQRLMFIHKIEMSDVEIKAEDAEPIADMDVLAVMGKRKPMTWQARLLGGCARANFCRITVQSSNRRYGMAGKLEVYGKRGDIDTTVYLYRYLSERGSFRLGAANEIRQRLVNARHREVQDLRGKASASTTTALVRIESAEEAIEAHVEKIAGKRSWQGSGPSNLAGFYAGKRAGQSVTLAAGRAAIAAPLKSVRGAS